MSESPPPFRYDLFVLHAPADSRFVTTELLPSLELDAESSRVMLPAKYELGGHVIDEIQDAILGARFTVLVVSRALHGDGWTLLGQRLAATLSASSQWRLIPLRLHDVEIDLALQCLVSLDFRDASNRHVEAARLRKLLDHPPAVPPTLECPYPGLDAFGPRHETRFFGRERQINELVTRIDAGERGICVIGPSGSGKSSLIKAGVLPRLARGGRNRLGFLTRLLRPTSEPARRLSEALKLNGEAGASVATLLAETGQSRLVLFIDQLEEIFTQASDDERKRFSARLAQLRRDPTCWIIVALRADFFGAFMESELWPQFEAGRAEVVPLRGDELRDAIARPAERAGVYLEDGLLERLVADTAAEPGALPLLQATLLELWDRLEARCRNTTSRTLSLADYKAISGGDAPGIATALALRANGALEQLTAGERAVARRVLMALVGFGDGRKHTRRQQRLSTLRSSENTHELDRTLAVLIERRILTIDRADAVKGSDATIDLSHEALITAWPTLRAWVDSGRIDEERKRALAGKVAEWRKWGDAKLLDAVELLDAERWLTHDAERAGSVAHLAPLVERSRAALDRIRRQHDEMCRLLAMIYQEHGRQLLVDGLAMRALAYLATARDVSERNGGRAASSLQILLAEAMRRLPVARVQHTDRIERVVFSADGRHVATASHDAAAVVWDPASGIPAFPFLKHPTAVAVIDACFSPDGGVLMTSGADRRIRTWRLSRGQPHGAEIEPPDLAHIVRFSRDGSRILVACRDRSVQIWCAATRSPLAPVIVHSGDIASAEFSPDGLSFLVAGGSNRATVHDAASGATRLILRHERMIHAAVFSPDGGRIATASDDHTARIWNSASGTAMCAPLRHGAPVHGIAFSHAGRRLVTASGSTALMWDVATGEPVGARVEHTDRIMDARFTPDDTRLVTAGADRILRITDAASGRCVVGPYEHGRALCGLALDPQGRRVITTSGDCVAYIWDITSDQASRQLAHPERAIRGIAFDPAGTHIATAGADGTARIWNARSGAAAGPVLCHDDTVVSVRFSPAGAYLATVSRDTATVWDWTTGQRAVELPHGLGIATAEYHADGSRVLTAGGNGEVRIWNATSGDLVDVRRHDAPVTAAVYSPDGARILATCRDGTARVWNEGTALCLRHDADVTSAAFSRSGRLVATASLDMTAQIWNALSGAPATPRIEHSGSVGLVAFSPDDTRLLTISDRSVRVWSAESGKAILAPLEHAARVRTAAFSPDGFAIAAAADDGTVWLWDAHTGKPLLPALAHRGCVDAVAFSADGSRLATAGADHIAWLRPLTDGSRTTGEWSELLARCPYELRDGVLIERFTGANSSPSSASGPSTAAQLGRVLVSFVRYKPST